MGPKIWFHNRHEYKCTRIYVRVRIGITTVYYLVSSLNYADLIEIDNK